MNTGLSDTHPDAERVQIELLRKATIAQRVRLTRSLSSMAMQLAWRAIEEANPGASEHEIALIFVAVHHGQDLANRLRADFVRRGWH